MIPTFFIISPRGNRLHNIVTLNILTEKYNKSSVDLWLNKGYDKQRLLNGLLSTMKFKIKEALERFKPGWTLYRLATEMGLSTQTAYKWQDRHGMPYLPAKRHLDMICHILECDIDDLLEPEPM